MQDSNQHTPIEVPTELMAGVEKIDIYRREYVEFRLKGLSAEDFLATAKLFSVRVGSVQSKEKWECVPARWEDGPDGRVLCLSMRRKAKRFGKPIPPMFDTVKPEMLVKKFEYLELSYLLSRHTHSTITERFNEVLSQESSKPDGWHAVDSGITVNSKEEHLVLSLQRQVP